MLRAEVDIRWPNRSTLSDGTISDYRHKSRKSDHTPDEDGYVRAWDCTRDDLHGPPLELLADFLRRVGATGSHRLAQGGYVIYNRRIASERTEWRWRPYSGENAHLKHLHVSCSRLPEFYKLTRPWQVADALDRARF